MTVTYHPMSPSNTCAEAWVKACLYLLDREPVNTLILHITDPVRFSPGDNAVIAAVDRLLRDHNAYPISTVANTIFPQSLYRPGEPAKLYERYRKIYPRMKRRAPDWGRYFDRMIRWPLDTKKLKPKDKASYREPNQLQQLIDNLNKYGPPDKKQVYNQMYELTLFHPEIDAGHGSGRQCLSFIEIKPEVMADGRRLLHMTALYRNHSYVARTLGNLIGLTRLLQFIAGESDYEVGSLTVHSTHAELDVGKTDAKKGRQRWGMPKIRTLLEKCAQHLNSPEVTSTEAHFADTEAEDREG